MKNIKYIIFPLLGLVTLESCSNDFVETEFKQSVEQAPLTTIQEVQSFVRGAYTSMRATAYYGADFQAFAEIRSDEMYSTLSGGYYQNVYNYTQVASDAYARDTYNQIYTMIAKTNIVINTDISVFLASDQNAAKFAQGQAYALRALGFFDALRLYGQKYTGATSPLGVVLPLKYDPQAKQPRATVAETEARIESDFNSAVSLMTASGITSTSKTDLTLNGVRALMSRYYLYKGDYAQVRNLVSGLYNKYQVIPASSFADSYKFNPYVPPVNSIFELAVGLPGALGTGSYRQRLSLNGYANVAVKPASFQSYATTDVRRALLTLSGGVYYLSAGSTVDNSKGKYLNTSGADNIKMIRYEEVLLNGVEAELNGGSPTTALTYYNAVITNRGLPAVASVTMADLKSERRKELLGEGFRLWDLLRWGDTVPRPAGASTDQRLNAFPIPLSETNLSGGLVVSNPGYDN